MRNLIVFIFTSIAFTQKSPCRVLIAIEDKRPLLHLQEFGWKPAYMCRSLAGVWTETCIYVQSLAGIRTGICKLCRSLAGVWTGTCLSMLVMLQLMES